MKRLPAAFTDALLDATRRAMNVYRERHGLEDLYGAGLYTSGEIGYVFLTVFSESGLDRVATEYAKGCVDAFPNERTSLRWSPCDSPHHLIGEETFDDVQVMLDAHRPSFEASDDEADRFVEDTLEACITVLRQLTAEGAFGSELEQIVLSVWMGDQPDEECLAFARELNSPSTVARFARELGESYSASALS